MVIRDTLPIHTWHTQPAINRQLIKVNPVENKCEDYSKLIMNSYEINRKERKKTFFNLIKKARMCIVYYVLEKEIVTVSKFQIPNFL